MIFAKKLKLLRFIYSLVQKLKIQVKSTTWIDPQDLFLIPPRELWVSSEDSFTHFLRWSWEYFAYLTLLCKLQHDGRVLELGCHHGRTAIALVQYLRPPGKYEGLDILEEQIKWANKHFSNPCFNFTYVDLYNGMYNPKGKISPQKYRFPYKKNFFDVVFAASLFTHLLPPTVQHYLSEIKRLLKPTGTCLLSFCLIDHYDKEKIINQLYELEYDLPGYSGVKVNNLDLPEKLVGYKIKLLSTYCQRVGLEIKKSYPGYWCRNSKIEVNEQDLVLIKNR